MCYIIKMKKIIPLFLLQLFFTASVLAEDTPQLKSIEQLEKEYKESPRNHEVNYDYCGKLIEFKKYSKAIEVCNIAIETGNKNTLSWSYLNRAVAYEKLGKIKEAKKDRESSKKHGMPDWLL